MNGFRHKSLISKSSPAYDDYGFRTKDASADSCMCSESKRSALTALLIGAGFCEKQTIKPPAEEDSSKDK